MQVRPKIRLLGMEDVDQTSKLRGLGMGFDSINHNFGCLEGMSLEYSQVHLTATSIWDVSLGIGKHVSGTGRQGDVS